MNSVDIRCPEHIVENDFTIIRIVFSFSISTKKFKNVKRQHTLLVLKQLGNYKCIAYQV